MITEFRPRIVGIGGTLRPGSSSERALRYALSCCEEHGATTELFTGDAIDLPAYDPESPAKTAKVERLIESLRTSHGVVVGSPGYHGSVSGIVKNALDYAEGLRNDQPAYFEGRAVGLIACAQGWQAAGTTLTTLRQIIHALRGWPTPIGVAFNTSTQPFGDSDIPSDPALARQLELLAEQVTDFLLMRHRASAESVAK